MAMNDSDARRARPSADGARERTGAAPDAARRAPRATPALGRAAIAASLLAGALAAGPLGAQTPGKSASGSANPTITGPVAHHWWDGGVRRPLRVDGQQAARFPAGKSAGAGVLVPAATVAAKSGADPDAVSPVLRDDSGAARALPGGVIVTLHDAPADEADARRRLAALGVAAVRPIGADLRAWLVAAPAGLESLALANRLHESGAVAAQPNWWQPRSKK
jgi:hypothetical protein